jgi:hypothetical protein
VKEERMDTEYPKLNGVTLKAGVRVWVTDRDHGNWDYEGAIVSALQSANGWVFDVDFGSGSRFKLGLDQIQPTFPNTEEAMQEAEAWEAARAFRPFISYASEDKLAAQDIYNKLKESGMKPWLDERDIPLGTEWDERIRSAIREAHIVLVLLSSTSIEKVVYFQKEVAFAVERAEEEPELRPFILPVKLEDVPVPPLLAKWQWANWYEERGQDRLMHTLRTLALKRREGE